jgi:hypothetical protein
MRGALAIRAPHVLFDRAGTGNPAARRRRLITPRELSAVTGRGTGSELPRPGDKQSGVLPTLDPLIERSSWILSKRLEIILPALEFDDMRPRYVAG